MSLVVPNFDEIQEDVTPGTYKVIVKKGEVKEWPNGGQYINWELETTGDTTPKNNGRRIFAKTAVSGKGAFMLQAFYRAAVGQSLTGSFDTEQLVGKQLAVEVVDGINRQTNEPTGYIEVKKFRPVSATT